nr:hypothetical protein [Tanacetum cinerariifolium]
MSNDRESSAAGTDSRAPMLEESEYESWKIKMRRYLRGKPNGRQIWDSVINGPAPVDQAESMLSQGLPRLTEQRKKEELYDEYERFCAIGNEPIHDYFVRFHKLINDLKITKLTFEAHQQNTKLLLNLLRGKPLVMFHVQVHPEPIAMPRRLRNLQRRLFAIIAEEKAMLQDSAKNLNAQRTTQYFKDMVMLSEARDRGVQLDAEAEAFLAGMECTEPLDGPLAITTTTAFQVEHEDGYDSDVDDGPHANVAFMVNLSATDKQRTSSSQPQEVHNSGYDLEENVVSYDAYLAEADLINETPIIPPVEEVVAPLPDQHSESLTDLQFNERFAML